LEPTKSSNGVQPNIIAPDRDRVLSGTWQAPGYLMIIGGADRLDHESRLARLFVQLVERVETHCALRDIVLISTATRHPDILTHEYMHILTRIGVANANIHAPYIRNRAEALEQSNVDLVRNAAGIFITGGDQYALTQILDRTPVEEAIRAAYRNGAVVAGTSAGATAMGRPMIVAGGGNGELRKGMVQMSHGLAWAGEDLIIDTHFGARGRFPRLSSVVAENPQALGVGIDENTCLLVDGAGQGLVVGAGVVYFIDASHTVLDTAPQVRTGQPLSIGSLNLNILAAGQVFDLRTRKLAVRASRPKATIAAR